MLRKSRHDQPMPRETQQNCCGSRGIGTQALTFATETCRNVAQVMAWVGHAQGCATEEARNNATPSNRTSFPTKPFKQATQLWFGRAHRYSMWQMWDSYDLWYPTSAMWCARDPAKMTLLPSAYGPGMRRRQRNRVPASFYDAVLHVIIVRPTAS